MEGKEEMASADLSAARKKIDALLAENERLTGQKAELNKQIGSILLSINKFDLSDPLRAFDVGKISAGKLVELIREWAQDGQFSDYTRAVDEDRGVFEERDRAEAAEREVDDLRIKLLGTEARLSIERDQEKLNRERAERERDDFRSGMSEANDRWIACKEALDKTDRELLARSKDIADLTAHLELMRNERNETLKVAQDVIRRSIVSAESIFVRKDGQTVAVSELPKEEFAEAICKWVARALARREAKPEMTKEES